jgi:large subunit ribosomal protein L30
VSDNAQRTIRIKWVRSGIGFTYHQKRIVQSLGLRKLNQEVERPDTPQIRGLVAKVPHLVSVVKVAPKPAWMSVPEYTVYPPKARPSEQAEPTSESPAVQTEKAEGNAMGGVTAGQAASTEEEQPVGAQAAPKAASEPTGALVATDATESVDASGKESAGAVKEASPEEGEPKA